MAKFQYIQARSWVLKNKILKKFVSLLFLVFKYRFFFFFLKKFIVSLGCFVSYLIKLNDSPIAISDELRILIAYMVNEENQFTFSLIFEVFFYFFIIKLRVN